MSHTLDSKTKRFYVEMGYTEAQVLRAYDYAQRYNLDILDALNNAPSASSSPQKRQNNFVDDPVTRKLSSYTLLVPLSKMRTLEYEPLYSRSGKHNQLMTKYELREQNNPVGLLNVSNCCYLNSLLQCYFLMNDFMICLLTAEPLDRLQERLANQSKTKIKRIRNEYELLKKLKNFFTRMALTSKKYMDPSDVLSNLVDSVGEKISYGDQKDLSQINITIIERLSEGLSYTKKYYSEEDPDRTSTSSNQPNEGRKNLYNSIFDPKAGDIKKLFYGTKVQYYDQTSEMSKEQPIMSNFAGLIINPRFATLYRALDQDFNFKVQINGKSVDKHTFIREQPQYLFIYINRTQYDREQGHMLKTEQKFTFDFTIYMDRYMQKYRKEKEIVNDRIKELIINANKVKEQMNYLQILFKKLEECYRYAKELEGWEEKLPKEEEFESEYANLSSKLNEIEAELKEIESRKQEYHLMYIFVHRGDAVSGHYWGYGRNGSSWYRFDINCRKMQQEEIIIDMQKSSGTAYALLYVKPDKIPSFQYQYHLQKQSRSLNSADFRAYFDLKHREEIITQNIMIHQEIQVRGYESIKKKAFVDYKNRYSGIRRIVSRWKEQAGKQKLNQMAICNNFSLFLCSRGQEDLYKFSVFEQAILSASNNKITIDKLLQDKNLLARIQKKFRKSCTGMQSVKHYCLLQKELAIYEQLQQEYQLSVFEVVWGVQVMQLFDKVSGGVEGLKGKSEAAQAVRSVLNCLRIRNNLLKTDQFKKAKDVLSEPLYVSQINNEISRLILLKFCIVGIKLRSFNLFLELSDVVAMQIASINSGNAFCIEEQDRKQNRIVSAVQQARELVTAFYQKASNKINPKNNNNLVLEKRISARSPSKKPTFQSTILGNPIRSPIQMLINQQSDKKQIQSVLTTSFSNLSLLLSQRQIWKVEELENIRINYDFNAKLQSFLEKVIGVLPIYRKIAREQKILSVSELREQGVELNQPRYTQSLI